MQSSVVETLTGAAVIVIAGVFLFFAYTATDTGGGTGYDLTIDFDRVDGLAPGADVRLSGIKVGTVTNQALDATTYAARVTISVSNDVPLPEDTSAKITSEGLLGGSYIALTPGGSETMLEEGDEIMFAQGSIDLIGLVSQAVFSAGGSDSGE
ncbi:outer membrane lipid asymmetry maintenance protein MlaD [Pyruvatibacter mobilis]|uniref:outer membrane lipid asymmetry maintenance protein MlaD n=1 Tax=Pyruvatibacter mobilis TaxID=1712261 RepID=UPI003BA85A02